MNVSYVDILTAQARAVTVLGPAAEAAHARRAFDLAHRARRLLELAAETASRNRWAVLNLPKGTPPREPEARYAAACAALVIKYPIVGEAKVYASLLDAVDLAHVVAEELYKTWLTTQPRTTPLPEPEPGITRLGIPLAPGCSRAETLGNSDEEITS